MDSALPDAYFNSLCLAILLLNRCHRSQHAARVVCTRASQYSFMTPPPFVFRKARQETGWFQVSAFTGDLAIVRWANKRVFPTARHLFWLFLLVESPLREARWEPLCEFLELKSSEALLEWLGSHKLDNEPWMNICTFKALTGQSEAIWQINSMEQNRLFQTKKEWETNNFLQHPNGFSQSVHPNYNRGQLHTGPFTFTHLANYSLQLLPDCWPVFFFSPLFRYHPSIITSFASKILIQRGGASSFHLGIGSLKHPYWLVSRQC